MNPAGAVRSRARATGWGALGGYTAKIKKESGTPKAKRDTLPDLNTPDKSASRTDGRSLH